MLYEPSFAEEIASTPRLPNLPLSLPTNLPSPLKKHCLVPGSGEVPQSELVIQMSCQKQTSPRECSSLLSQPAVAILTNAVQDVCPQHTLVGSVIPTVWNESDDRPSWCRRDKLVQLVVRQPPNWFCNTAPAALLGLE
ncbi:hypothetical protein BaRGS_00018692 [Batillaria attramentaria]|uniref:Uncharacterized protein n=1 Tax=Batillaria attramentaria TaxID=370345 RepID=A0ABD0KRU1_9CAEN